MGKFKQVSMDGTWCRWFWDDLGTCCFLRTPTPLQRCVLLLDATHHHVRTGHFSQRQRSRNNLITFTSHVDEFWMFRQALRRSFQMKCGFRVTTNLLLSLWERWFNVLFGSGGSFPKFKGWAVREKEEVWATCFFTESKVFRLYQEGRVECRPA